MPLYSAGTVLTTKMGTSFTIVEVHLKRKFSRYSKRGVYILEGHPTYTMLPIDYLDSCRHYTFFDKGAAKILYGDKK